MALNSQMIPLGTPAPDFTLPKADGSGDVSLHDYDDAPALLVAFLCVHCPYVKHVEEALGAMLAEYDGKGLAVIGISSNDTEQYPEDAPDKMVEQAARAGFTFPYVVDATQEVAKAYRAACTPDFFLYDADRKLAYRGQFDSSRHKNDLPLTGEDLRGAIEHVLAGEPVPEPHTPSQGCGIKWKPGNEPAVQLMFG
jgi:peroxiredoxin